METYTSYNGGINIIFSVNLEEVASNLTYDQAMKMCGNDLQYVLIP